MPDRDANDEVEALAHDIVSLARATLLVDLRFLDAALAELEPTSSSGITIGTDGKHLVYWPRFILRAYAQERTLPVRFYLHTLFHCLFSHPFVSAAISRLHWNLACDIATEAAINDLGLRAAASSHGAAQEHEVERFRGEHRSVTAERVYRALVDQDAAGPRLAELQQLFSPDDHSLWYERAMGSAEDTASQDSSRPDGDGSGSATADSDGDYGDGEGTGKHEPSREQLQARWKQISARAQVDLETASHQWGDSAGNLMQSLREVTREEYDYSEFLRRFAVPGEIMKVNDDEFDYVFYTYGLSLYGNLPLIEPLEYAEAKLIREFVIALDTSGSVSGELVQRFVQKTYNILKQSESFFTRINVRIIQCDADIQEDVIITSQEEFDDYLSGMTIKGHGGTDFRPVFRYVDELISRGEFVDLKGLVYFTDGYGNFPAAMPSYDVAFVFVDDEYRVPEVPPWAIKLVLGTEEI